MYNCGRPLPTVRTQITFALRASKQKTINNQPPKFRFAIKPVVFVVFRVKFLIYFFWAAESNSNLITA